MSVEVIETIEATGAIPDREASIQLVRGGVLLDISDALTYGIVEYRGFGLAPLHRLSQRGPYQHGATDRGFRLDPRPVYFTINTIGTTHATMHEWRQILMAYLRPGIDPVGIRYNYKDSGGSFLQRQLDCFVVRGMDGATGDRLGFRQRDIVELVANDPTWYAPTALVRQISLDGGGTGVTLSDLGLGGIQMQLTDLGTGGSYTPMAGGSGSGSFTISMNEANVWDTYPTITAVGPLTNLTITNTATGDVIGFTGTIPNGDVWTIDLRYGYKTIKDLAGVSQIGTLTAASALASFRLVPGDNSISFSATSTSSISMVQFSYNRRYIGV